MGPWIEAAKSTIKEMIAALPAEEPHKRVAIVAYRDFGDGEPEVHAFSEDIEAATNFLDRQTARGGNDEPEDVAGGLATALALPWQSETRTLVLVLDAPCHGKKYHSAHDAYPDGDPTGLSMVQLTSALRKSSIDFTFVQLTSGTEQMQGMLKQVYEAAAGPENIRKFELRDLREILRAVGGQASPEMLSAAVTPSIRASYASTSAGAATYSPTVHQSYETYAPGRTRALAAPSRAAAAPSSMPARLPGAAARAAA